MSKEEIALQLTLSRVNNLAKTTSANNYTEGENYNAELGKQIALLYNTIYHNLDCYKPSPIDV